MATYFISQTYMETIAPVSANIDFNEVTPFINNAEQMWLQEILGTKFFDSLKASYSAQTLTADQETLVGKIKPYLVWKTLELYLPFANTKIHNIGTVNLTAENATQADLATMKVIRAECANNAEWYAKRIQDYLCAYGDLHTDYTSPDTNAILPNNDSPYDCGLWLED